MFYYGAKNGAGNFKKYSRVRVNSSLKCTDLNKKQPYNSYLEFLSAVSTNRRKMKKKKKKAF